MSTVYHGAVAGVVLTAGFATKNPVTIASDGTVSGNTTGYRGAAIYASGYAWTIANRGTVAATGSGANGVTLEAGGVVVNGGSHATSALISGVYTGIATYASATITNYGTIAATGTAFQPPGYVGGLGIYLGGGGLITNGAKGSTAATIAGYTTAITVKNSAGTIVNFGTLANTALGDTIYLNSGAAGSVIINQAGGLITGRSAIDTTPAAATSGGVVIVNYGTIANTDSTAPDIYLGHGGQVTNGAGGLIAGLNTGVSLGAPGTVVNAGTIVSTGTGPISPAIDLAAGGTVVNSGTVATTGYKSNAIDLGAGGVVVNGARHAASALIGGVYTGIATYASATITNYGTIAATGTAFQLPGYISGVSVYLGGGGLITNGARGSTAATIAGYTTAITIRNSAGTIVNFGTLANTALGDTIYLNSGAAGSVIINQAGGLITGRSAIDTTPAAAATSGGVVIANYGTIVNTDSTAPDIYLGHGGQVTNGAGGLIAGLNTGVSLGAPGTVVNAGAITGGSGTAISFGGTGGNLLALEHGYKLGGTVVVAGSANTLELLGAAGKVTVDFDRPGAGFTNFGTVAFGAASGHDETLTISDTAALPGTIAGFTQLHDIVDLTQLAPKGATATLNASDQLVVSNGLHSVSLQLDPSENYSGVVWQTTPDGKGGTDVAVQHAGMSPFVFASASLASQPLSPSFGFGDIAGVPGSAGGTTDPPAGSMPVSGDRAGASLFQSPDGGNMAGVDPTLPHITLFG